MNELTISGKKYIASSAAAKSTSYTIDYLGQLCRAGKLDCQQVAGTWFVAEESLTEYIGTDITNKKDKASKTIKKEVRATPESKNMIVDGVEYIPSADIASKTGYTQDYIGQLARKGEIPAKRIGRRWYADLKAVLAHKKEKDLMLAKVQVESVGLKKTKPKKIINNQKRTPIKITTIYKAEPAKSLILQDKSSKKEVVEKLSKKKDITTDTKKIQSPQKAQERILYNNRGASQVKKQSTVYFWVLFFITIGITVFLIFIFRDILINGRLIHYSI